MAQSSTERSMKIDRDLGALTSCDMTTAWSLLKETVEKQVGKNFACIPYITEGLLYDITSVFVKIDQAGGAGRRVRTYRPLGLIENLLEKEHSWEVWHNVSERIPPAEKTGETLKITLEDAVRKTSVSATFNNISNRVMPVEFTPVGQVILDANLKPDLGKVKKIYFINEVMTASEIRICIVVKDVDRIVVYKNAQPIAFRYHKFALDSKKMVVQRIVVPRVSSLRTSWVRLNVKEDYTTEDHLRAALGQVTESTSEPQQLQLEEDAVSADTTTTADVGSVEESPDEPINLAQEEQQAYQNMASENVVSAN